MEGHFYLVCSCSHTALRRNAPAQSEIQQQAGEKCPARPPSKEANEPEPFPHTPVLRRCVFASLFWMPEPCLQTAEHKACAYWWPLTHSGFEMEQFPSASLLPSPELLPVDCVFTSTETFGPSLC